MQKLPIKCVFIIIILALVHVNVNAYDAQNTGRSSYKGNGKAVINWSMPEIGPSGFIYISPIVDKRAMVFLPFQVYEGEQGIMALSADKKTVWKYDFKDKDRVFFRGLNFSQDERSIYLLYELRVDTYLSSFETDSGKIQWNRKISGRSFVNSRITVSNRGHIYVANKRGINAIDKKGKILWTIDAKNVIDIEELDSPTLSPDENTVYCYARMTDTRQVIYALNAKDGKLIWKTKDFIGKSVYWKKNISVDTKSGTIYVAGVDLYVSSTVEIPAHIYALNPDGSLKWEYKITANTEEGYLFPAVGLDGTVYIGTGIKRKKDDLMAAIIAINPDGKLKWSYALKGIDGFNNMISIDNSGWLYLISSPQDQTQDSELHSVDQNGKRIFKLSLPRGSFWGLYPSISPDGSIYVYSAEGDLYSIK